MASDHEFPTGDGSASELHPPLWQARVARQLRFLRHTRGWRRLSAALLPSEPEGAFLVRNRALTFAGNLSSYIEREIYVMGGYEEDQIEAFLDLIPPERRGVVLDVGANVGTHAVAFAQAFEQVHAFEPNHALWPTLERNVALNGLRNVTLHRFGLGDTSGSVPFYAIAKDNHGLGTVLAVEQYDLPLQQIGIIDMKVGDDVVERQIDKSIDAIKIDVQGLEPQVLSGLRRTLRRDRPILWVEVGGVTAAATSSVEWLKDLIDRDVDLFRFQNERRGLLIRAALRPVIDGKAYQGDYVLVPH